MGSWSPTMRMLKLMPSKWGLLNLERRIFVAVRSRPNDVRLVDHSWALHEHWNEKDRSEVFCVRSAGANMSTMKTKKISS